MLSTDTELCISQAAGIAYAVEDRLVFQRERTPEGLFLEFCVSHPLNVFVNPCSL